MIVYKLEEGLVCLILQLWELEELLSHLQKQ